jgi:hypothetical protein
MRCKQSNDVNLHLNLLKHQRFNGGKQHSDRLWQACLEGGVANNVLQKSLKGDEEARRRLAQDAASDSIERASIM